MKLLLPQMDIADFEKMKGDIALRLDRQMYIINSKFLTLMTELARKKMDSFLKNNGQEKRRHTP